MLVTLLLTSFLSEPDYPACVPDVLRDEEAYELMYMSPAARRSVYIILRRISDDVTVSIDVMTDRAPTFPLPPTASGAPSNGPSDGYPLGTDCRIINRPSKLSIRAKDGREIVTVMFLSPKVSTEKFAPYRQDDFTKEEAFCVQLARIALSRYAARRAGSVGKVSIDGTEVDTFVATESAVIYYDLEQYVRARGSRVSRNDTARRYSYTLGGKDYVALLGSSEVKIGSIWIPMPDVPMEFDGRVWLPLEAFR